MAIGTRPYCVLPNVWTYYVNQSYNVLKVSIEAICLAVSFTNKCLTTFAQLRTVLLFFLQPVKGLNA